MKLTNKLLLIGLWLFSLASCTLVREDYSEIYVSDGFESEADIYASLTGLYAIFGSEWQGWYCANKNSNFLLPDLTTDQLVGYWGTTNLVGMHPWEVGGTDGGSDFAATAYSRYNDLSRIRSVMMQIENAENVSETYKTLTIAETKCLYGWVGTIMYDLFGTVPLATDEQINDAMNNYVNARPEEEEYLEIMETYLTEAIADLPVEQESWGRLTKGAARMILMKLYMFSAQYDKALVVARELQQMEYDGTYGLFEGTYAQLFSKEYVRNCELIHVVPCGSEMGNYWHTQVLPSDFPYITENIYKWGTYLMPWDYYDTFEYGDERLETIVTEYVSTTSGKTISRGSDFLTKGCIPLKYAQDSAATGEQMTIDCVIFRYADVLLTLAELITRDNGAPTDEAIELVNRIRRRVGLDDLVLTKTNTYDVFMQAILDERGHELYLEGHRRADLIRHDQFVSTSQAIWGSSSQSDWYKVKFFIPQEYILEAEGRVVQNPGY